MNAAGKQRYEEVGLKARGINYALAGILEYFNLTKPHVRLTSDQIIDTDYGASKFILTSGRNRYCIDGKSFH